jgi:UDPglucose 6-dehydrogenase
VDPGRANALARGRVPFHEPGLQAQVEDGVKSDHLRVVEAPPAAFLDSEATLVCVGTPMGQDGDADVSQVQSALQMIAAHGPGTDVVIRSTLPLGASGRLAGWLGRSTLDGIATNPEFLRQGSAVADFRSPTRIVIGTADGSDTPAGQTVRRLYRDIDAPVIVTDFASAEMIKNTANAFLATKLSFMNEIADLCEAYGATVDDVIEGIGLDPRIGPSYLRPGIGFGGSCLPKELASLVRLAHGKGLVTPLLESAANSNDGRPARIVDRLSHLLGELRGARVTLLGLAFKANTDDLRYSPALGLAAALSARGAIVVAHDPAVPADAPGVPQEVHQAQSVEEAIEGSDLVIIATEWPEYASLDWAELATLARRPVLYDGRRLLPPGPSGARGWRILRVGGGV